MTIAARLVSALLLTGVMAVLFWLTPNLQPEMFGATTPARVAMFFTSLFAVFWAYLVVQGYPVSHGHIGSSSTHNLDNIIRGFPRSLPFSACFSISWVSGRYLTSTSCSRS